MALYAASRLAVIGPPWQELEKCVRSALKYINAHFFSPSDDTCVDNQECPTCFLHNPLQSPLCVYDVSITCVPLISAGYLGALKALYDENTISYYFCDIKHDSLWSVWALMWYILVTLQSVLSSGFFYKYFLIFHASWWTVILLRQDTWLNAVERISAAATTAQYGLNRRDEPVCHNIPDSHG